MSAYITKLEIPGFSGSNQLWKSFVNSFEAGVGGGGSGSMSSDCFTLESPTLDSGEVRLATAEFLEDRIRLCRDFTENGNNSRESNRVILRVTPSYEGKFPDSFVFRLQADAFDEGLHTPFILFLFVYDIDETLNHLCVWEGSEVEYDPYAAYDSGDIYRTIEYPEGSTGLSYITIEYSSSMLA